MIRIFCLCSLLLLTSGSIAFGQNTVGLLSYEPAKSYDGYNLIFPHNQGTVYLLDNCGQAVHTWEDSADVVPGNSVYLLENGNLLVCKRSSRIVGDAIWAGGGGAIVELRSWENELLWSWEQNNDTARLHHDIAPLPNGNVLMLAWELITGERAIAAGRDTSKLAQGKLWPDYVYEVDINTNEIVWEWHAMDHLIQEFDPSKVNYGSVAAHPELIDINWDTHDGHPDWMHSNALDYNPVLDQILLSVPYFNEVWVIDHSTTTDEAKGHVGGNSGMGGDLIYRWGNPATYRRGDSADQKLFFPHDIHWTNPNAEPGDLGFGRLAVFNNRVGVDFSTGNMFQSPIHTGSMTYERENGRAFGPIAFTRTIQYPNDPSLFHSTSVSSVQLLPNENVLMLAGRWGQAVEISPQNELVWEYIVPLRGGQPVSQGESLSINNNLTFRMERYPLDHPAFVGRDLSPIAYVELAPNETFCSQVLSNQGIKAETIRVFPNPVVGAFHLASDSPLKGELFIWGIDGRVVHHAKLERVNTYQVSTHDWSPGLYTLSISGTFIQKIMVLP